MTKAGGGGRGVEAFSSSCRSCPCGTGVSSLVAFLVTVIVAQWILCAYLLQRELHYHHPSESTNPSAEDRGSDSWISSQQQTQQQTQSRHLDTSSNTPSTWDGVAVVLMLRRPRWYVKRYNTMLHNVLSNIPPTWALQLFVFRSFFEESVLTYHRGIRRLLDYNASQRIFLTDLPSPLNKQKPNAVLADPWLWDHVVAERVLVFNGDGALCSNSNRSWEDLRRLDYVGIPWEHADGRGGDGTTHSLRSRSAMRAALRSPYFTNTLQLRRQDRRVVATLLQMNQRDGTQYQIASVEETEWFGGTFNLQTSNGSLTHDGGWGPLIISGTQAGLSQDARNWMIGVCPEIKQVFPSLHHPGCFGARPDNEACARSLGLEQTCAG